MSQDPSEFTAPVSAFVGPVGEMIAQQMLSPPSRPGLLAVVDHFEILRILGGGGMGIVLLARDSRTGRDTAVKLVKSGLVTNQEVVRRFLKEAGHLKKLRHTNIVPVDEISERPEAPYFVMPYFEKGSLANRIKPGQPLAPETILDIATQVAEGLSFAHRSGIIHRDLKPANILVAANGTVCLADFGLARTLFNDTIVDVEGRQLEGTAPYMSPAVAAGDAEDTRCDIYSFGALLYEMLTGEPPYKGQSTKEILNKIIAGPPKPITSLNPAADRRLVAVAEQAMARELRDRYADMRDILKDLQHIKDGKQPHGKNGRSRNPLPLYIGGIIVVLITILALVIMISRLNHAQSPAASKPPTVTTNPVATPPAPAPATALVISTFAGQPGTKGYMDGPAAQAEFHLPNNVAVDHSGNVYVADTANDVIRKIMPNGMVTTLAGVSRSRGSADGQGANARFWAPFGIAVDAAGTVYVADTANNTIRKITTDGMVSTLAGLAAHPGTNDGNGFQARFRNPWGVAVDNSDGDVFVADMSNNTIRRITPAGEVNTFAGEPGMAGSVDGFGNDARFDNPFAVAVDSAGDVYVSDSANNAIRKITHRVVTTLAGLPGNAGNTDGQGANARFWNPQGLAVDSVGNIYVADTGNNLIRKITPMGVATTIPEPSPDDAANSAGAILNSPGGVAVDSSGNIYIADTNDHCIREVKAGK
jgi:serine/threonine protein kinase/sugar lactone lactonase YvrE